MDGIRGRLSRDRSGAVHRSPSAEDSLLRRNIGNVRVSRAANNWLVRLVLPASHPYCTDSGHSVPSRYRWRSMTGHTDGPVRNDDSERPARASCVKVAHRRSGPAAPRPGPPPSDAPPAGPDALRLDTATEYRKGLQTAPAARRRASPLASRARPPTVSVRPPVAVHRPPVAANDAGRGRYPRPSVRAGREPHPPPPAAAARGG